MNNLPGTSSNVAGTTPMNSDHNPMKDYEVISPPDDTISCMAFSPPSNTQTNFLIAGSWDNHVRCWEIGNAGYKSIPKQMQSMTAPVLDVAWSDVIISLFLYSHHINNMLLYYIFRMEGKCSWLVVTKWLNAGIWGPMSAFRYYCICYLTNNIF